MTYEAVIGLEVHARLLTRSKIFCACATARGAAPNTLVCPVCLGLPGALPVLNRRAVELAARAALALGCAVHEESAFSRKSYFYPDLPKGYQITQLDRPLATGGVIDAGGRSIRVERLHLEEDAGKTVHDAAGGKSLVDLNRAGVPLIEIVTAPDLRSPEEAAALMKALRQILVYLDVCDGDMEEGSLRCDANVSIRPVGDGAAIGSGSSAGGAAGSAASGVKTEIKNLNSFSFVERALRREIDRQTTILEGGGAVVPETLLFDPKDGVTRPMRAKEGADDYRYFPEPDLQALRLDAGWVREISAALPELPAARRARFAAQYGLPAADAGVLTASRGLADYYEDCVRLWNDPATVAHWVMTDLLRELNRDPAPLEKCPVTPNNLVSLIKLVDRGEVSHAMAREIFAEMYRSGSDAPAIVRGRGLLQLSDAAALERIVAAMIAAHPAEAARYLAGHAKILDYFMGALMKETRGRANPAVARELIIRKLKR